MTRRCVMKNDRRHKDMKYRELMDLLEQIAPTEYYEDEDNSGIQVHDGKEEVNRVLVCLEMNDAVLEEAAEKKADMIITHHPLLFHPLSKVDPGDPASRYVIGAVRNGIDIYSSHLPFDAAARGNNMYLAELLKLQDVAIPDSWDEEDYGYEEDEKYNESIDADSHFVAPRASFGSGAPKVRLVINDDDTEYEYDEDEIGSIGYLPKAMSFQQFQTYVERCLDLPRHYVRCVDGGREEIRKVAFCTGAGGEYIFTAVRQGCDAYITGDLKLHEAQFAKASGLTVIDAGHYGTEKIFTENMAAQLRAKAGDALEVIEAEANTNPYTL